MGGCNSSERANPAVELSETFKHIMKMTKVGEGHRLRHIYDTWPLLGDPVEISFVDAGGVLAKRESWPRSWTEVEDHLRNVHNLVEGDDHGKHPLREEDIDAIKQETVLNSAKPHITDEVVTWPCLQNLFRDAWEAQHGKMFLASEHRDGEPWHACNRARCIG